MKIAIMGVPGSFHEQVALGLHYAEQDIVYCRDFSEVADTVVKGIADGGLIAIENSTAGSILPNHELILRSGLKITSEVYHRVSFSLLAPKGVKLEDVRYVDSHPMALLQCRTFLNTLGKIQLRERPDTATAAREISTSQNTDVAAIAHEGVARLYGLEILASAIETEKKNLTRFVVVRKKMDLFSDADKMSVCFRLPHHKGKLARVLTVLDQAEINLTRIQSLPVPGDPGNYFFYLDLEFDGTGKRPDLPHLLHECTQELTVLGCYQKGKNPLNY